MPLLFYRQKKVPDYELNITVFLLKKIIFILFFIMCSNLGLFTQTREMAKDEDKKELLAAQEDRREVSINSRFVWPDKRGGLMKLLRKAQPPEITARAFLLLPPECLDRQQSSHCTRTSTWDSSKPSRWPETDIFGQAWSHQKVCQSVKVKIN